MSIRQIPNFSKGLRALRAAGFSVHTNLSETRSTDVWAPAGYKGRDPSRKLISFERTDMDRAEKYGELYLSHRGGARKAVIILRAAGVDAAWNADYGCCIVVRHPMVSA